MLSETGLTPEALKKMQDRGRGCGKEVRMQTYSKADSQCLPSCEGGSRGAEATLLPTSGVWIWSRNRGTGRQGRTPRQQSRLWVLNPHRAGYGLDGSSRTWSIFSSAFLPVSFTASPAFLLPALLFLHTAKAHPPHASQVFKKKQSLKHSHSLPSNTHQNQGLGCSSVDKVLV